jgi:hypothetical protein
MRKGGRQVKAATLFFWFLILKAFAGLPPFRVLSVHYITQKSR